MTLLKDDSWQELVLAGSWRPGSAGTLPVVSPSTGEQLATVGAAGPQDVAMAAETAVGAQQAWAARSYQERAAVLRRAGELFGQHAEEISSLLAAETGTGAGIAHFQTASSADECFEAAALASHPYGEVLRSGQPRLSLARRIPVGVVGVIAPFNVPILLAMRAVAPALALGNAVIIKPDPRTAVSGGIVIARIFEEAGLPEGLLSVLPGGVDTGQAVVTDPRIPVIAFTGSTRAGRAIGELAGRHLKRAHLELGGNSALIVLDDVDVEAASSVGAFGSFNHQGQICMATSRHLVHTSVAEEYTARLAARAEKLAVGDPAAGPVALGPLIDAGQRDAVHAVVTASVEAGARLVTGGTYDGLFYRPTVLADVPVTAPAFAQEIFGPVAPVTPFTTEDEAVELARSTEYGLSLGILTSDVGRALRLSERIPSGLVHINDQTVNDEAIAPFGGVGASGTGSRHGGAQANLEAFTETQWVTVRTELPQYPF
ncbi:benzaldehyde dehydrogenase [Streptomyces sp. NRRL S-813]|uniref:benzaldehyde dehydrogenase n=1 Tax=Streptomyces sp. NRRL S-813 TaxID=1463919 RepID=UPI0004BEC3EB|nr:benzaldehyde dehydrogenase [Streptomyces sp. NRRL S-813]